MKYIRGLLGPALVLLAGMTMATEIISPLPNEEQQQWHSNESTAALLQVLATRAEHTRLLAGEFRQTKHLTGLPMPLVATGKYHYNISDGLRWETLTPIASQVKLTQQGIEGLDQGEGGQLVADIFLAVVRGNLLQLKQYFTIHSAGDVEHWQLRLQPSLPALASYIKYIDVSGSEITEQLTIVENSGDNTLIELTDTAAPNPLTKPQKSTLEAQHTLEASGDS